MATLHELALVTPTLLANVTYLTAAPAYQARVAESTNMTGAANVTNMIGAANVTNMIGAANVTNIIGAANVTNLIRVSKDKLCWSN